MFGAKKKKIVVGMSGGVDSSVSAALLVRDGYDVHGVFMRNWTGETDGSGETCGWRKEREDAAAVAELLGIPFETWDFEQDYRQEVYEYMLAEYAVGRTPNPDVLCNDRVKFGPFLRRALDSGAEAVATGHYARLDRTEGGLHLLAATDDNKDQSYFLHRLSQEQLLRVEFPIGGLDKPQVRALAHEFGLPVANKKDSVGLCFVGEVNMTKFLTSRLPGRTGPIVTSDGRVLGRHDGIEPFTIGQRHGLGLGDGRPYFVIEKDPVRNTLVVAEGEDPAELYSTGLVADDLCWVAGSRPDLPLNCRARIRYRQPLQNCLVTKGEESGQTIVSFVQPQRAVAPGQFVVFYNGEECLGGGRIVRAVS
ncbi:TPA: tRNA 2-thiouridine(34) synthase MnmA [Candidatus Uhrbacteria bacterium]|nr:tRNA 2-thiouridine(34) synthase MnmA [Candidatus Uhrbacteria bacterium]